MMKITQVTPGLIEIPPKGWGAIEKIIWNYKLSLEKLGHTVDIKYLNDVDINSSDIIHIHVANLAIEAKKRGIPYIFSLHDHHAYYYGKDSQLYKENLEAIKGSIISFTHAEFLINYFNETDKLFYLSHGVDTNLFKSSQIKNINEHRLLCVANNGLANNQSFDRKGFGYAIKSAMELNLPITIAGPENNNNFLNSNPELLKYEKLSLILDNPNEEKIIELFNTHTIFLHPSMLEAGHPNLTLLESLSMSVPVVGTYLGTQYLGGLEIINDRDDDNITEKITKVIDNYNHYVSECSKTREKYNWDVICDRLSKMYSSVLKIKKDYTSLDTKQEYITTYESVISNELISKWKERIEDDIKNINDDNISSDFLKLFKSEATQLVEDELYHINDSYIKDGLNVEFINHYINGAYLEIKGDDSNDEEYTVQFIDNNDTILFENKIKVNHWVKTSRQYFTKWKTNVYDSNKELIYSNTLNLKDKRVLISLDSKSLGDTIAWLPYVEEFRTLHKCHVICSTFKNFLFEETYPNIEFVPKGKVVQNITAQYNIGWYYDNFKEPILPNVIPLQKTCTNILGLPYNEIKPNINFKPKNKPYEGKYITIATESTAGLKLWNHPTGWETLCGELKKMGYKVINISNEGNRIRGAIELKDKSLENTMNVIHHSDLFIGLSSGLSWLSWALGKHVVMISNFTNYDHEFMTNCTRITNTNVCHGCWNNPMFKFDKGDWNWCPEHKDTERHFECHKSITPDMVINTIKPLLI